MDRRWFEFLLEELQGKIETSLDKLDVIILHIWTWNLLQIKTTPNLLHRTRSITVVSTVESLDVFLGYVAVQEMFILWSMYEALKVMCENTDWVLSGFSCNCVVMWADSGMLDQDIVGGCLGQGASAEQFRLTIVFSITASLLGLRIRGWGTSTGHKKKVHSIKH